MVEEIKKLSWQWKLKWLKIPPVEGYRHIKPVVLSCFSVHRLYDLQYDIGGINKFVD